MKSVDTITARISVIYTADSMQSAHAFPEHAHPVLRFDDPEDGLLALAMTALDGYDFDPFSVPSTPSRAAPAAAAPVALEMTAEDLFLAADLCAAAIDLAHKRRRA